MVTRSLSRQADSVLLWRPVVARTMCVTCSALLWAGGCGANPESATPTPKPAQPVLGERVARVDALGQLTATPAQRLRQTDDQAFAPEFDGWETEAFVDAAQRQLQCATDCLAHPQSIATELLSEIVSNDFSCTELRPTEWTQQVDAGYFQVRRGMASTAGLSHPGGAERFADALSELAATLARATSIHTHLKFYRVSVADTEVTTTVDFEASGRLPNGAIQQNATWIATWTRGQMSPPLLRSLRVSEFEEITTQAPSGPWFSDCTQAVLGSNESFSQQLVHGQNHWMRRIERVHQMQMYERNGLAVGDVNADGRDDLYICQCAGLPNRLFVQQPNGTALDISHEAGVDWLDDTLRSASGRFGQRRRPGPRAKWRRWRYRHGKRRRRKVQGARPIAHRNARRNRCQPSTTMAMAI